MRHAFSPNGRQVAVLGREEISLWDMPTGEKVWSVPSEHSALIVSGAIAFTPDGRRLITGHDCTALVWDVTVARRKDDRDRAKLSNSELTKLWDTLAGGGALGAYQAEWELTDRPAETAALLRERLKPVKTADVATVRPLLAQLDAPQYAEREAASKALRRIGESVVPALRQALKGDLSAEQRSRVESVLADVAESALVLSGESLRQFRAVSVLERAATPDARKLLAELASGNPEARLTKQAAAASARLSQMPAEK
jgi:hypothetical protein